MRLPACQNTPALDAAIYRPDSTLYQLQPSFHTYSTGPSRHGPRSDGEITQTTLEPEAASISDATVRKDHNALALFTIDRLARAFVNFYQTWQEAFADESYGSPK